MALVIFDDRKGVHAVLDCGVEFRDAVVAGGVVKAVLGHVAVLVPELGQAAEPGLSLQLLQLVLITGGLGLVDVEQDLVRGKGAETFLHRLQNLQAELGVSAGKKFPGSIGQSVGLFRAAHALGASPGVQIPLPLQPDAVLFDAHVGQPDALAELADGEALAAFDLAQDGEFRVVVVLGVQPCLHSEELKFQLRTERESTPEFGNIH